MKRRDFITLIGGTAVCWPSAAFAQDAAKVYRVGLLSLGAPFAANSPLGAALIHGLAQDGYIVDKNWHSSVLARAVVSPSAAARRRACGQQGRCHRYQRVSIGSRRQTGDDPSGSVGLCR